MEVVAKENWVTIMDHEQGEKKEEFVDDPMVVPRRIMERWSPQSVEDLPDAFCGSLTFLLSFTLCSESFDGYENPNVNGSFRWKVLILCQSNNLIIFG